MTDHLDRAAEVMDRNFNPDRYPIMAAMFRDYAHALDAAGLLVSPERDAAVAALPLPVDGCACTPHEQSAGGVYTEYLLEYEPACPEHSEHLWDPTQGAWVLRSEHDAAVAARALREAAEAIADTDGTGWPYGPVIDWLHYRADRIEGER